MPGAAGFLVLSQALLGPERYGFSRCLETMPSAPSLHTCAKMASAVALEVLAVSDPIRQLGELGLAPLERPLAPILAVELPRAYNVDPAAICGLAAASSV
jgi:hypothetical protein